MQGEACLVSDCRPGMRPKYSRDECQLCAYSPRQTLACDGEPPDPSRPSANFGDTRHRGAVRPHPPGSTEVSFVAGRYHS